MCALIDCYAEVEMTWPIVYLVSSEACVASIIVDSANTRRDDTSTFVSVNCLFI